MIQAALSDAVLLCKWHSFIPSFGLVSGQKKSEIPRSCSRAPRKQRFEEQIEQLSSITHQKPPEENHSADGRQGQANVIKCSCKIVRTRARGSRGGKEESQQSDREAEEGLCTGQEDEEEREREEGQDPTEDRRM